MADRRVTATGKDRDGDITSLCNAQESWKSTTKWEAIADIEAGMHTYHVIWDDQRTEIEVVNGENGKYLRTVGDSTTSNNLLDLPDC